MKRVIEENEVSAFVSSAYALGAGGHFGAARQLLNKYDELPTLNSEIIKVLKELPSETLINDQDGQPIKCVCYKHIRNMIEKLEKEGE